MTEYLRSDTKKSHHIEKGWTKNDKNSTDAQSRINQNVDRKKMLCRVGELRCCRKRLIVNFEICMWFRSILEFVLSPIYILIYINN